jgi:hypothetical protein
MTLSFEIMMTAVRELDEILTKQDSSPIELRICGGGALIIMGISSRETRDIDVILPLLPPNLKKASDEVATKLNIPNNWLNNGPTSLTRDLTLGWEDRCNLIFDGTTLKIYVLGRIDFLATKLFAYCDRDESDLDDLLLLKLTFAELDELHSWVMERDGSDLWPARVNSRFEKLKARLQSAK